MRTNGGKSRLVDSKFLRQFRTQLATKIPCIIYPCENPLRQTKFADDFSVPISLLRRIQHGGRHIRVFRCLFIG